jgi:phosphoglycerol transferase MdoB-like AlkP superfamily enzyme
MIGKIKELFLAKHLDDIKFEIRISVIYFVSMILLFSLFRLLFCIVYADAFVELSFWDKAISFAYGLRFDVSAISTLLGVFIILFFVPLVYKSAKFLKFCVLLMSLSIIIIILILCADFFFFPQVKRHMTEEVIAAFADKEFIIKYSLQYYWWVFGLVFCVIIFSGVKIFKYIDRSFNPQPVRLFKSILIFISIILFVILGARGGFGDRPVNLYSAYSMTKKYKSVQLILNGVFTQYHSLRHKSLKHRDSDNEYPLDKAVENTQNFILSLGEFIPDNNYPLMRQIKYTRTSKNFNIFIVLLEGWTPKYIDSLGNGNYGITPNFDEIVKNGIIFTNAYANGYMSTFGLSASFSGVTLMPGMLTDLYSLEVMNNVSSMPEIFNKKGYFTMFTQAPPRNSLKMCTYSKDVLHVQESYGKEDIPRLMDYLFELPFGYDYDMFDFTAKKVGKVWKKRQPFFVFSFTGTTHTPFNPTIDKFDKYPRTSVENKYLNSLCYADYSIGHLMYMAKKDGWFDDTIFIFMADHVCRDLENGYTNASVKERFNIPFVLYAPKIFKPQKIDYVVSQADLIPTIYHLMEIQSPFSVIGTNALDKNANHFALMTDGINIVLVEGEHYISNNRMNVVESSLSKDDEKYALMNDTLLSLDKAITESIKYNRWYKATD